MICDSSDSRTTEAEYFRERMSCCFLLVWFQNFKVNLYTLAVFSIAVFWCNNLSICHSFSPLTFELLTLRFPSFFTVPEHRPIHSLGLLAWNFLFISYFLLPLYLAMCDLSTTKFLLKTEESCVSVFVRVGVCMCVRERYRPPKQRNFYFLISFHGPQQCFPTLVLEAHCPACFGCFPALTHLILRTAVQKKPVNQLSIEIRCADAGKHLKHPGRCALRTRVREH